MKAPTIVRAPVEIDSSASVKKLCELGFDPIVEMVKFIDQLDADIAFLMYDDEGNERKGYSKVAVASLQATRKGMMTDLLRYGYARVTEGVEVTAKNIPPVVFTLAGSPADFDITKNEGNEDE